MKITWVLPFTAERGSTVPVNLKLSIPCTYILLHHVFAPTRTHIKIKRIEKFTEVPTCFGVQTTPSSWEQCSSFSVFAWRWCDQHTETCGDLHEVFYTFYFNLWTSWWKYMLLPQLLKCPQRPKTKNISRNDMSFITFSACVKTLLFFAIFV